MANTRSFKPKSSESSTIDLNEIVGEQPQQRAPQREYRYDRNDRNDRNDRSDRGDRNDREDRFESRDLPTEEVFGFLDVMPEGHGFLRPKYIPSDRDVYISSSQIRRFNLRAGDYVEGGAREPKENE